MSNKISLSLVSWFRKKTYSYHMEINALYKKYKSEINFVKRKEFYYDYLRAITELFYIFYQYCPEIYELDSDIGMYILIKEIYIEIPNIYNNVEIKIKKYIPLNNIELAIINALFSQLYETEKMCLQFIALKEDNTILKRRMFSKNIKKTIQYY